MRARSKSYPGDLSDEQWELIEGLIPPAKERGSSTQCKPSGGDERIVLGVMYGVCMAMAAT